MLTNKIYFNDSKAYFFCLAFEPPCRKQELSSYAMKKEKKKVKFRAETLIRNATTNNVRYIINADRKARILIIVNAGIISVIMSLTDFQVPDEILPALPKAMLLISNIASLLFGLKAVESLHTAEKGNGQELKNLLDFHQFGNMPAIDYIQDMKTILDDSERVLDYAVEDLYWQGKLLQKKYGYLKMAFRAMGFGMLAAVIVFLIFLVLS